MVDKVGMESTKLSFEQNQKLRKAILDPKAKFAFMPFATLKEAILKSSDPKLNKLPDSMKALLLNMPNDAAIAIDNQMVLSFVEGRLDADNAYLFQFGEIRVVSEPLHIST